MSRILRISPDPLAVEAIREWSSERPSLWDDEDIVGELIEKLAARSLAPMEWTLPEWRSLHGSEPALIRALRNPKALLTAEKLLSDGLAGTCGHYVGVRSWKHLCSTSYSEDRGGHVPSLRSSGFDRVRSTLPLSRKWLDATRGSGQSYGDPGPLAWRCADQILAGPPWIDALYRTGFGLWCWEECSGAPGWALIARDGNGLPWPEVEFSLNTESRWEEFWSAASELEILAGRLRGERG